MYSDAISWSDDEAPHEAKNCGVQVRCRSSPVNILGLIAATILRLSLSGLIVHATFAGSSTYWYPSLIALLFKLSLSEGLMGSNAPTLCTLPLKGI